MSHARWWIVVCGFRTLGVVARRRTVKLKPGHVMTAAREVLDHECLVYVFQASCSIKYALGSSRIAYIGTTQRGLSRISESLVARANCVLDRHGVKKLGIRVVTCSTRKGRYPKRNGKPWKPWFALERALLGAFRDSFGSKPICNDDSKAPLVDDDDPVWDIFRWERIYRIVRDLSKTPRSRARQ